MTSTCTDSTRNSASVYSSSSEYLSGGENLDVFNALRSFINAMPSKTEMSIPATALLGLLQFTMNLQARCDHFADAAATFQRSLKISEIMMRNECPKLSNNLDLFLTALKAAEHESDKAKLNKYAATEPSDLNLNDWIASALDRLGPTPDGGDSSNSREESAVQQYSAPRITAEEAQEINGSLRALDLFKSGQDAHGYRGYWGLPQRATALLEYAPSLRIEYDLAYGKGITSLRAVDHNENPHVPAEAPHHQEFYAFRNERYATGGYIIPPPLCAVPSSVEECGSVFSDDSVYEYQRALTATPPASRAPSEYEEVMAIRAPSGQPICIVEVQLEDGAEELGCAGMGLLAKHAPQRPARVQPASGVMLPIPPPSVNTHPLRDRQGRKRFGWQMFGVMAPPPPDTQPASHGHAKEAVKTVAGDGLGLRIPPHIRDIRKHNPTYLLEKYPVRP